MVCRLLRQPEPRSLDRSAAFAPMEDPQIAIAVYVENGGFGAVYGVPIGALMMEQYIKGGLSEVSQRKADDYSNRVIDYGEEER